LALTGGGAPSDGLRVAEQARERSETGHAGATGIVGLARGAALRRLARPAEALAELDDAVALLEADPLKLDFAQARIERGLVLLAMGRRLAASVELEQAGTVVAECEDAGAVALRLREAVTLLGGAPAAPHPLSERELEILALLPSELSRREIAAALFVSLNTVQTHLRSIYRKLGVASRSQAVARAREQGLLDGIGSNQR
jgi:LuxR family maltose regulon positive regulatory protein